MRPMYPLLGCRGAPRRQGGGGGRDRLVADDLLPDSEDVAGPEVDRDLRARASCRRRSASPGRHAHLARTLILKARAWETGSCRRRRSRPCHGRRAPPDRQGRVRPSFGAIGAQRRQDDRAPGRGSRRDGHRDGRRRSTAEPEAARSAERVPWLVQMTALGTRRPSRCGRSFGCGGSHGHGDGRGCGDGRWRRRRRRCGDLGRRRRRRRRGLGLDALGRRLRDEGLR